MAGRGSAARERLAGWPKGWIGGALVVLLLALGAIGLRLPTWHDGTGAENLEASYHVVLTMEALDRTPAREHLFLPIVSLGQPQDKHIAWGAAVENPVGDQIYTSFFPAGFVLPYAALKAVGAGFTLHNLALFNALLGTVSALVFYLLAWRAAELLVPQGRYNRANAVLATLPLLLSTQALQTTGLVYWHQCATQLVLSGMGLALLALLTGRRGAGPVLVMLAFVGPLFEWSALIANGALFLVLALPGLTASSRRALAGAVALATAASLALTFAQFAAGIGLDNFVQALVARFGARSAAAVGGGSLVAGYVRSFGLFLIVLVLAVRPAWARLRQRDPAAVVVLAVVIVLTGACAENLLLSQHAAQFAFDRFKLALPLGLILLVALGQWQGRTRTGVAALVVVAALGGIAGWYAALRADAGWVQVHARNLMLRERIDGLVDRRCALFASDGPVRGQTNLWLMRGVHEAVSPGGFRTLAGPRPPCGAVYLHGTPFRADLIGYTGADVLAASGRRFTVTP